MANLIRVMRVVLLMIAAGLSLAPGASALEFNVDSIADETDLDIFDGLCVAHPSGRCTLRAAVIQSGWIDGDVTIRLPSGTYVLTSTSGAEEEKTDLDVINHVALAGVLTIEGSGPASTVIDGNHADRVMAIGSQKTVHLKWLTVRNGNSAAGGGIHNGGILTVDHCAIRGNASTGFGGGILNEGNVDVAFSTVDGNSGSDGGGIWSHAASIETYVRNSTISRNTAFPGNGGGIFSNNLLRVTNSTIAENHARQNGGGISGAGVTRVYNSTIVDNEADSDADPDGGVGGGFRNSGTLFELHTSIVQRNRRAGATSDDCAGGVDLYGNNAGPYFWASNLCTFTQIGPGAVLFDFFGAPLLSLRANGGPTETIELSELSGMIDASHSSVPCDELGFLLTRDQRNSLRPLGVRCDIGAFEFGGMPQGLIFSDAFETGDRTAW